MSRDYHEIIFHSDFSDSMGELERQWELEIEECPKECTEVLAYLRGKHQAMRELYHIIADKELTRKVKKDGFEFWGEGEA